MELIIVIWTTPSGGVKQANQTLGDILEYIRDHWCAIASFNIFDVDKQNITLHLEMTDDSTMRCRCTHLGPDEMSRVHLLHQKYCALDRSFPPAGGREREHPFPNVVVKSFIGRYIQERRLVSFDSATDDVCFYYSDAPTITDRTNNGLIITVFDYGTVTASFVFNNLTGPEMTEVLTAYNRHTKFPERMIKLP